MNYKGFLCFLGALCLLVYAPLSAAQDAAKTTTIVVFGDSLISGHTLPQERAFPAKLEVALREKGHNVRIYNLGNSGDTTLAGKNRIHQAFSYNPDLVILGLGANDVFSNLSPDVTRRNLKYMVETLIYGYVDVMVLGLKAPDSKRYEGAKQFEGIFEYLRKRYSIPVVPDWLNGVHGRGDMLNADGIHPNAKGVERMVSNVLPYVESYLTKK